MVKGVNRTFIFRYKMSTSNSETAEDINQETETIEVTIPEQKTTAIPLFLKKLWKMVNDTSAEQIIGWNPAGDGFVIYDQLKFVTELLPQYFKHNNLSSFIRQLNFYDFHKVANIDKNEMEFSHSYFLKDLPETLSFITRKVPNVKSRNIQNIQHENINEVLVGVKEMKNKHSLIENELKLLKQENAALWNEINSLRIKYSKQTKVINKLIHFLISYMHSHQNSFTKTNIVRKPDQLNLRNAPQLFQIGYLKASSNNNENKTNVKIPSSRKTVTITTPNNVKNSSHSYYVQPKLQNSVAHSTQLSAKLPSKKYPVAKVNSYPLESTVTEIDPETYNVTSPEQYDSSGLQSSSQFQYPIEEIETEVDPDLEETSTYTVKFPKTDLNSKPNMQKDPKVGSKKITQHNAVKPHDITLQNVRKVIHDKRKLSDNNLSLNSVQNPKILKMSQRGKRTLKLNIPTSSSVEDENKQKSKPVRGKKKIQNISQKALEKNTPFPQPSPVKPEVVLENLFTEISNPPTEQNMSDILSDLPSNPDDLHLPLENDSVQELLENQPDSFLLNDQPEFLNQEDLDQITNCPSDLFSSLSSNTAGSENAQEEILTAMPVTLEPEQPILKKEISNDLECELESYPEEVLSNLSNDLPLISRSQELLKYNIIQNPKENLGLYLDNTQIQLNNIQDILNDLNSEELFDLLSCFNPEEEEDNVDQRKIQC